MPTCWVGVRLLLCRDTAGQERYESLAPLYYRGATAAVIVFDVTRCARWPLLRAFLAQWIPPAPSVARQCLLDALGEDSQQGEPDVLKILVKFYYKPHNQIIHYCKR